MWSSTPLYLLLLLQTEVGFSNMEVYGSIGGPEDARDATAVSISYAQCFLGIFFSTCRMVEQYDDDYLRYNALPYYRDFNDFYGETYCLQCCGGGTDVDYWNLRCETSEGGPITDMYGYEVRFARNKFLGDTELIYCPIPRSVCVHNETDNSQSCDEDLVEADLTYLHGITIELHVKQMYYAQSSWRHVTYCNVTADERNYELPFGSEFEENYIMHHEIGEYKYDAVGLFFLFLLGIILVYAALYYFRRQRCYVCEKKLIVFKDRCYLCRFYGAHMPDPVLIKALQEKAEHGQGEFPQRFWCSKRIVKFCRKMASCVRSTSRGMAFLFCCQCCCLCCQPRGEACKMACCNRLCCCLFAEEEIHPEDALELEKADGDDDVHSRSTISRAKKVNPYLIKKHPHIIQKAVGHPWPAAPPGWIKHRNLDEEFDDRDSTFSISTKNTPHSVPETISRHSSEGLDSDSEGYSSSEEG